VTAVTRADLLERYRSLSLPDTSQEAWRFTSLKGFDPDTFVSSGHIQGPGPGTAPQGTLAGLDVAGSAQVTEAGIEIVAAPEGVVFEALTDAEERIGTLVAADDKFTAQNAAVWEHGLLVRVPKGVVLEKPLHVRITSTVPNGSLFFRMVVVAERESRFSLVEEWVSATPDLPAYTNGVVELFVEDGAKLEYVSLQSLSQETWHFATHHARVERDAELDWVAGGFGSKKGKIRIQNDLAGAGATSRVTGAYFADGDQHLDYDTFQEHMAPSTTSDFAFKGALRENATAVWRGMIRVEAEAQKTNAYQENRNLLLSDRAHADSIPGLEILANDVRCTHGATIGKVDREQLFYLMSRGLPRNEAERLIVRGFFTEILDRIELEPVREALGAALDARLP
jgi:Fe-S cluster assembly protein SufD